MEPTSTGQQARAGATGSGAAITGPPGTGPHPRGLADELNRLVDRLRSMSDVRLARPLPDGSSRADAARALAQQLAHLAADLTGQQRRQLPRLPDLSVGDQVAVTGHDLLDALADRVRAQPVTDASGSAAAAVPPARSARTVTTGAAAGPVPVGSADPPGTGGIPADTLVLALADACRVLRSAL